ncbi:MAG: hypothetical protein H6581_29025 [Bacteroidia bacterium]|nr:hypothetical protein [Bacteroidia bacterium]
MEQGLPSISNFLRQIGRPDRILVQLWLLVLPGIIPAWSLAQNSVPRRDSITFEKDTLVLPQKYIVPFSFQLLNGNQEVDTSAYEILPLSGALVLRDKSLIGQPLVADYRYFPRFLNASYTFRKLKVEVNEKGDTVVNYISSRYNREQVEAIELGNLRKSGSISRGVTVGNKQSLNVTSGLRLQVEGDIGDDIKILAAITDENIPIQPDGTTQQINDFDKVFVQMSKGRNDVVLGDFEINHKGTWFSNFYRNVQGIAAHINTDKISASVNGAVAKGKYFTNTIAGKNGVQGPYRLVGKNNERFIIVLAGSEKVYLNGDLMTRGEANDYTIDYNTGELYFTSQRIINNVSRIVVDFEYSDRFYNRSLMFAEFHGKFLKDKLNFGFSYGRDADNQNAPIDLSFSEADRDTLRMIGDDNTLAFTSGVDTVEYSPNTILYERRDTTIGLVTYERYVLSTVAEKAIYNVSFTYVGTGNGYYLRSSKTVNGTVFDWVAPDTSGKPTGDYAPIKLLALPQLLQVADFKADYQLTKKVKLYSELAISSRDKNRFSPLDDDDNVDLANKTGILVDKISLGDSVNLKVDISHKYIGERYTNIDRINKIEYGREWNFDDLGVQQTENVTEALVELRVKRQLKLLANAGIRTMGEDLFTVKQLYEVQSWHKSIQGKHKFTTVATDNQASGVYSRWDRHNGDIYKKMGWFKPGVEVWIENKKDTRAEELQDGSFRFYDLKPYIRIVDVEKFSLDLNYNYRLDLAQKDSVYRKKSLAHTEYIKFIVSPVENLRLQNTTSYREFYLQDSVFAEDGLGDSKTLITNFQGNYFTKNRLLYSNLIYEVTSEQLAKRDVAYIETNPGQGQYIWEDKNGDNQQDLDEFLPTTDPTLSPNYIQVVIPTRDLRPTTNLNFQGNFKLDFKRVFDRSKNPFKETLRNFISITNFRLSQKKEAGSALENYLINIKRLFADTTLLDARYTFREDVYFFQNNPVGDLKFSFSDNKSMLFLSVGQEFRSVKFWGSNQRLNFGKNKSIENEIRIGDKVNNSENLEERNYNIHFLELSPQVNFQLSRKVRLSLGYDFKDKVNHTDSVANDTRVSFHKVKADLKINFKDRNNLFTKLELVYVGEKGPPASFAADYELKESLKTGFNALWQVFSTIYFSKTLELGITYDGRASEANPVIHTGRVQLKAFF